MVTERIHLASPLTTAGERVIASPFQWLFTGEDAFRIVVFNSLAGVRVRVQGRFLLRDGRVQVLNEEVVPTSDRLATTRNFQPGSGFLLNLSVFASSGAPVIGQTYVMVQIIRGFSGAQIVLGALLGGYITAAQHLAYPGSPIQSSIEGGGYYRAITGTDPAAGNLAEEVVPTGARWELISYTILFVTSAVVGNRRPFVYMTDGAQFLSFDYVPTDVPASSVVICNWHRGAGAAVPPAASGIQVGSLAEGIILSAGHVITGSADGLDAADDFQAPTFTVREWLEAA